MASPYAIRPIGVVRSAVGSTAEAPKQGALSGMEAEIHVDPKYARALDGLAERTGKIIVLCWMHEADRERRTVHPRGREDRPERGVFSTRSPHRPNPISLHTVELLEVRGTVLRVRGMDAIDGTPVVDIKPHSPDLDD
jgi:tRNA-Thr(GGU) m(6)t(6)A37 methyltransferase TsaA